MKGFATENDRIIKAKNIEISLKYILKKEIKNLKILEVGCGSGAISNYLSRSNTISAVDIETPKKLTREISFKKVKSEKIPFKKNSFDIVISNHVIEHVKNQNLHLSEIERVMKNKGVGYLATPNKIFPIEPHYKIPFIHYLSRKLFRSILKIIGVYKEDVFLLSYPKLKNLVLKKFIIVDYTPIKIKQGIPILKIIPKRLNSLLSLISPTNVFLINKNKLGCGRTNEK